MWPFRDYTKRIIVLFEPPYLYACMIVITKKSICITNFMCKKLDSSVWSKAILVTSYDIEHHLKVFVKEQKAQHTCISIGLASPLVAETLITAPSSNFIASAVSGRSITTHYLYPTANAHFCYYISSVAYEILFQYQLLSTTLSLNLIRITTSNLARLFAYKHSYGNAFRQSQLASDMYQCNNHIADLHIPHLSSLIDVNSHHVSSLPHPQHASIAGLSIMDS